MLFLKKINLIFTAKSCESVLLAGMAVGLSGCGLAGAAAYSAGAVANAVGYAAQVAPLKLIFSCLPEGTQIDTPNGSQSVESLKAGDKVIGYSGKSVTVKQIHEYDEDAKAAKFMTVEFHNGAKVNLCEMHRIGGVRAINLKPGDKISAGQTVKSITRYVGVEISYDLLTDDAGYRIGGIPVNSMIGEMAHAIQTGEIKD